MTSSSSALNKYEWLHAPHDWEIVRETHVGKWISEIEYRLPDGRTLLWNARRNHKHFPAQELHIGYRPRIWVKRWLSCLWVPSSMTWWVAWTFIVGSIFFAVGSMPGAENFSAMTLNVLPLIGSVLYTVGCWVAFWQVGSAAVNADDLRPRRRIIWWAPQRLDWVAATIMLIGAVIFTFMTIIPFFSLTTVADNRELIWSPDIVGCICFNLSSFLSVLEARGGTWGRDIRARDWWITNGNMIGSMLFMASAIGAWVLPDNKLWSLSVSNGGTFWGALCFLVAAVWLLPEAKEATEQQSASRSQQAP